MNSVLFAGLFVFGSAVLGDNKGSTATVNSVVWNTYEVTFDPAASLKLFFSAALAQRGEINPTLVI